MAKDFSNLNTEGIFETIQTATAEEPKPRGPRKEWDKESGEEYLMNMETMGRKGLKLKRINMAFAPDVYQFIQVMARVRGETLTEFVNKSLRAYRDEHDEVYKKAIEFRNSL